MDKIIKARSLLLQSNSLFGKIALSLEVINDDKIPTMATNGEILKYNSEFVNKCTMKELVFIWTHEIAHVFLKHHIRLKKENFLEWNICADYAINQMLVDYGFTIPASALLNPCYKGMNVYQIYDYRKQNNIDPTDYEKEQAEKGIVEQNEDPDKSEKEVERETNEKIMKNIMLDDKNIKQTNIMKKFKADITENINGKVEWDEVLQRFIKSHTDKSDYTWSRPNRNYIAQGLYLPSLHSKTHGKIALAIDTSGSVPTQALDIFIKEIKEIFEEVDSTIQLLQCDYLLRENIEVEEIPEPFEVLGGGGTNFDPAFEALDDDIDGFIYFTDGKCDYYPREFDKPMLWVLWEENNRFKPKYGEIVVLN